MSPEDVSAGPAKPTAVRRAAPLTAREWRAVALAAVAPIALAAVVLGIIALVVGASVADVAVATAVYGGLLALASGFVAFDRIQARQCPRCQQRNARGAERCAVCGYDVMQRPRYSCEDRHRVYLDPGLCECGRRLQPLPMVRGIGPQIRGMLRLGAWLLAFLLILGALLRWLD